MSHPAPTDSGGSGPPVGEEARKLTVYFGERTRCAADGFAADRLLDIFGRYGVATSILLRGIEGFGIGHRRRSDLSLALSEDPPLVAVAVDTTARIDALGDEVRALTLPGLVTLERARIVRAGAETLPAQPDPGEAVKLTVYVGRRQRVHGMPAYLAVCDLMHQWGLSGASVFLGVDGTAHGVRQRAGFFDRNADVPVMIIAVGGGPAVSRIIPELGVLLRRPLFTVERVRICKRDGALLERRHELPGNDSSGMASWQKIMVFTSESTLHHRVPIHRALVRELRSSSAARGATVIRGIWGFHGDHRPHGDRLLQVRRRVPVCTIVVDEPDRIARAFPLIDALTAEHGLVTSEVVPAVTTHPDGRRD